MLRDRVKPEKFEYARRMRKNPTPAERELWEYLRCKRLGLRFGRQRILRGYIVDFYAPQVRLVVEVDGRHHVQDESVVLYDRHRDGVLAALGILTLRFWNDDVFSDVEGVVSRIREVVESRRIGGVRPFGGKGWGLSYGEENKQLREQVGAAEALLLASREGVDDEWCDRRDEWLRSAGRGDK